MATDEDYSSIPDLDSSLISKLKILHIKNVPICSNYESISSAFSKFGIIREIRMKDNIMESWDAWLSFDTHAAAFEANKDLGKVDIDGCKVTGSLSDHVPRNLEIYKPSEWNEKPKGSSLQACRTPKPPTWIIAYGNNDRYNYYKMKKCIQKRVGSIRSCDISGYGKQSVLIHAKSETQDLLLCNMKKDDIVKNIKPQIQFSYGRGVVFDKDLYEFSEEEILEMCPYSIWKVSKVPKANMIIFNFDIPNVPDHVYIENERVHIRPYKPRPMQCLNCFGFGHPAKYCKNDRVCGNCSALAHGDCSLNLKCVNCDLAQTY